MEDGLLTTATWGLRAFPLNSDPAFALPVQSAIVPRRFDISGVRRANNRLELVGLVALTAEGALADQYRSEVQVAVVLVGETLGQWLPGHGPRFVCQVPPPMLGWNPANPEEERPAWAYLIGTHDLPGAASIYADQFEVVPA